MGKVYRVSESHGIEIHDWLPWVELALLLTGPLFCFLITCVHLLVGCLSSRGPTREGLSFLNIYKLPFLCLFQNQTLHVGRLWPHRTPRVSYLESLLRARGSVLEQVESSWLPESQQVVRCSGLVSSSLPAF